MAHADFKQYLKQVEDRLGRLKGPIKSGPRTMDLDIITVNGVVVHDNDYHKSYVNIPVDQLIERLEFNIDTQH